MNTHFRIAVADSEPDMRKFLHRVLTHEGHKVIIVAESGRQLVSECRRNPPELVITDIQIPDQNGLEALREICSVKAVPAIIVTAVTTLEVLAKASDEMVFAFLVKPIKMDDLRPAIWMTMRRFHEMIGLQHQLQTFL
jgi:two-component system, response regulator PdtaR